MFYSSFFKTEVMSYKIFFHYLSYLQYPLMLIAIFFAIQPYLVGLEASRSNPQQLYESLNSVLVFMGLGISFSSLQDTSKTQNKMSKKIWEHPKKGKMGLFVLIFLNLFILVIGLLGYFATENSMLKELSFGIIILGIGMLGMLKAAIEMFEHHQKIRTL